MLNVDRMRKANDARKTRNDGLDELASYTIDAHELFVETLHDWLNKNGNPEPGSMKYNVCLAKASQEVERFR